MDSAGGTNDAREKSLSKMRYYSHILLNLRNLLLHSAIRIQEPPPNNFRAQIMKKKIRKCWHWEFQRTRDTWKKERNSRLLTAKTTKTKRKTTRKWGEGTCLDEAEHWLKKERRPAIGILLYAVRPEVRRPASLAPHLLSMNSATQI
jgi:hypothetical protein